MRQFVLATTALLLVAAGPAAAEPITFQTIADTHTPIPGGTGTFNFFTFPAIDGLRVAFQGADREGQRGIYTSTDGILSVRYDRQTPVPAGSGTFSDFTRPALAGGSMVFVGSGTAGQLGVYTDIGGSLLRVADLSTPIPGGTGTFTSFSAKYGTPVLDGTSVAFGAAGSGSQAGIYRWTGGGLNVVADTSTLQPGGGGPFQNLSCASIDGPRVAFFGSRPIPGGFREGLYLAEGGLLSVVADTTTAVPGGMGTFAGFGAPSLVGDTVVFVGEDSVSGLLGIYSWRAGQLSVLYDTTTLVPDGVGTFTMFGFEVSVDGSQVAFFGIDSAGTPGIFANLGGSLLKVLDSNTRLDGQAIVPLSLGLARNQLSGNRVAFYALLEDGTFGVYTATVGVPEPSAFAAFGLGALGLLGGAGWRYARRRYRQSGK
jgi:hypothetical protein